MGKRVPRAWTLGRQELIRRCRGRCLQGLRGWRLPAAWCWSGRSWRASPELDWRSAAGSGCRPAEAWPLGQGWGRQWRGLVRPGRWCQGRRCQGRHPRKAGSWPRPSRCRPPQGSVLAAPAMGWGLPLPGWRPPRSPCSGERRPAQPGWTRPPPGRAGWRMGWSPMALKELPPPGPCLSPAAQPHQSAVGRKGSQRCEGRSSCRGWRRPLGGELLSGDAAMRPDPTRRPWVQDTPLGPV
jgi:hypothetical protein